MNIPSLLSAFALTCIVLARATLTGQDLIDAVDDRNLKKVQELIGKNIDINTCGNGDATPLHHAARNGHKEIVEELIRSKANVNAKSKHGGTPLHRAAYGGQSEIIKVLLDSGAEIEAKDGYGMTALHIAALRGKKSSVDALLDKGADIYAQDKEKMMPLHLAVKYRHKEVTKSLLKHAIAKLDNKDKKTLYDTAYLEFSDSDIQELLKKCKIQSSDDRAKSS